MSCSLRIVLSCVVALLIWPAHADSSRLSITGSSTLAPLVLEIAKRYENQHPGVRIDVQTGGSTRGLVDARRGSADIGMVSRALTQAERDLTPHLLALDGVALIVHSSNSASNLSSVQVAEMYAGTLDNWKSLGGPELPVTLIHKAEGRSTLEVFLGHFGLRNSQIKPNVIIGDNQQGIKTVAGNPGSVGYVSIGTAAYEAARGTPIKLLALDGVPATVANVRTGEFPLARELNLVTRGEPEGLAKAFIDFAKSSQVNDLIRAQFFVSVVE